MEVKVLWAQEKECSERVVIEKCDGAHKGDDSRGEAAVLDSFGAALGSTETVQAFGNITQDLCWCRHDKEARDNGQDGMLEDAWTTWSVRVE